MDHVNRKEVQMDTIGDRLKSERLRLGLTQDAFSRAGGSSKPSQVRYERGERFPDGDYFSRIALIGADLLYILTGERTPEGDDSSRDAAQGIDKLLFMLCANAVEMEYKSARHRLPRMMHLSETVWAYNELLLRLADPSDGDEVETVLPQIKHLIRKRLTQEE